MKETFRFFFYFYYLLPQVVIFSPILMVLAGAFDTIAISVFFLLFTATTDEQSILKTTVMDAFTYFHIPYTIVSLLILANLCFLLRSLFQIFLECWMAKCINFRQYKLQNEGFRKLVGATYLYFCSKESGSINFTLTQAFQQLFNAIRIFAPLMRFSVYAILYASIAFWVDWSTSLLAIVIGTPLLLAMQFINPKIRKSSTLVANSMSSLQTLLIQLLNHFKYLKASSAIAPALRIFDQRSKEVAHHSYHLAVFQSLAANFMTVASALTISIMIFYKCVMNQQPIVDAVFPLILLKRAIDQIIAMQQNYRKFLSCYGFLKTVQEYDQETETHQEIIGQTKVDSLECPIEFRNITFCYQPQTPVLKDLSLTIQQHSTVAFVGESGCGKSTLVTLLTGILRPSQGDLYAGNTAYADINLDTLRERIGYVSQECVVFNDTVRDNITLWSQQPDEQRIVDSLRCARLTETIDALESGLDSPLGDQGMRLSGGQRQRVNIARELYKDTDLLIFDEATSALDSETEFRIQQAIDELKGSKTIVLIAHRLSTIRNADCIYVLDKGAVVQSGTYNELAAMPGLFRKMLEIQMHEKKKQASGQPSAENCDLNGNMQVDPV